MRSDTSIIQCITAFMKAEVLDGEERPVSILQLMMTVLIA
jgi:hypothetical protein